MDGYAAVATEPGSEVADADFHVVAETGSGDAALGYSEQLRSAHLHVLAQPGELVGALEVPIEDLQGQRHECRVSHPSPVMAVARLPLLVGAHLGESGIVGLRVVLNGDLRRHSPHGEGPAPVAGLDEQ